MTDVIRLCLALAFIAARIPNNAFASATARERATIAIEDVAVVDVVRGEIVGPRTVLVVDGRIAGIHEPGTAEIPPNSVRIDGGGRYLIPGLVDMHVHLFNNVSRRQPNEWAFPLFVANGVTAVREMWTEPASMPLVESWRNRLARGELVAPRILAAGAAVRGDSEEGARRQIAEARSAGADFVKVFSEVSEPVWRASMSEAGARHMPVCGHIPPEVSLLTAATAGQKSNEHLTQIYEACSTKEAQLLGARKGLKGEELVRLRDEQEREVLESFDQSICDRIAAALARTGQVQVPTLVLRISKRVECIRSSATIRAGVICESMNKRVGSEISSATRTKSWRHCGGRFRAES